MDRLIAWPRGDPRWLVDADDPLSLRAALRLYLPSRLGSLVAARGMALTQMRIPSAGLLRRSGAPPSAEARDAVAWLRRAVGPLFPVENLRVAAYLGSPGALRKLTAVVLDGAGEPLVFAKIATSRPAGEALRHEAHMLSFAAKAACTVVVPEVIGVETDGPHTLLLLQPVRGSRMGNRTPMSGRVIRLVTELHEERRAFDGRSHRRILQSRLDQVPQSDLVRFLAGALRSTEATWAAIKTAHFSHGDLTPWNCLSVGNGLGVVDWEMAGYRLPGWDVFHYLIQIESITRTTRPDRAADRILLASQASLARQPVLAAADIELASAERWTALCLLSLIEGAVHYVTTQPAVSQRGITVRGRAIARMLGVAAPPRP